ncbi:GLPGLI family protein [Hymenobacter chitinivorans]|uniref:GLPGLI family protein n=1 Tax=Hymenobacter chitinivorans DSM 11115 TaxID=1121954 RepID=A0A2M9B4T1_9BACT|nr:GLPGLI family protein [Hymenobacter chitinivorans]PJJ52947.1 GLPGLI family protein [Hymenobacter chitinivorans DSM 11115]
MKKLFLLLSASTALLASARAQTSGQIQYEVTQKVDPSQMRVMVNGQEVKPGSPDFPSDISDVRTFPMTLSFAGGFAKEERQNGAVRTVVEGGPGAAPQTTNLGRPFEEAVYVNMAQNQLSTVLTVKKDNATTTYRTDAPFGKAADWQNTDQTKKIAGYTCRKATVPFKKETYTVWYTTELPFTYSPVKELLPEKGVVLALESSREQYRATKVNLKAVAEAEVKPTAQAQIVTAAQLQDLREKARADFRQRLFDQEQRGN